jgi:hypothetical protein
MIARVAEPFATFRNLRARKAIQYPDAMRKPEEICLNVFMAFRFDFRVKVTSQASLAQVPQAHLVVL